MQEYYDRMILTLREKYRQEQTEQMEGNEDEAWGGTDGTILARKMFFEGAFSMMLPEDWTDMSALEMAAGYRTCSGERTIRKAPDGGAVLVLSRIFENEEKKEEDMDRKPLPELQVLWETTQENMKKLYRQNVFYDNGTVYAGELPIFWQDMKAFCLSGSIYCLIFLFRTGTSYVSGNFHCDFEKYVMWRPAMLKLLRTIWIQAGEGGKQDDVCSPRTYKPGERDI